MIWAFQGDIPKSAFCKNKTVEKSLDACERERAVLGGVIC